MNYIISITDPGGLDTLSDICRQLQLPLNLVLYGRGTATKTMLDLLGIKSHEKRIVMSIADQDKTNAFIREQRRRLYIDAPGNGIVISIPVKSVGGGRTLAYLNGDSQKKCAPEILFDYELILAIVNEGCTDTVMDAARAAGATGGTVLHGKGTGADQAAKFFQVSIAKEKEIILIVSKAEKKAAIMRSILSQAGPETNTGAIVLSLPVNNIAGFIMLESALSAGTAEKAGQENE